MTKHSSGIIYQDIVFIDKLYEEDNLFIYAQWDYINQHIEIFTGTWKQQCKDEDDYIYRLIYTISHEVLHSEIEFAIAGEDYGSKDIIYNEHYPYLNGMDEQYVEDIT